MGICESAHHGKALMSENQKTCSSENSEKNKDEESSNQINDSNSQNQKENGKKNIDAQQQEENNCPKLDVYDRSMFISGMKSEYSHFNNKTVSVFSNGKTEEEVIIKGEINKDCKNKEEDFDNNSFKDLVKKNGGIIIKKGDSKNSICSNKEVNRLLKYGKENISEIKSKHTFPFRTINGNMYKNNLRASGSSLELIQNKMNENNNYYNKNKNNEPLYKNLRNSIKVDVSMQESNQFLNIPKIDEPLPDLDELSNGNPFTSGGDSLISDSI